MKVNIFFFLSSEVGHSVTTTSDGLFDESQIKPQEPYLKEKLIVCVMDYYA